jgi:hypothetical protein
MSTGTAEKISIYERLAKFQGSLTLVSKDKTNPFYKSKYAPLDSIQETIKPLLTEQGLAYTQAVTSEGLHTVLYSIDGETIDAGFYPVSLQGKPQDLGSAITYARRYALCSFLGLIVGDEDDDGNTANNKTPVKPIEQASDVTNTIWLSQEQFDTLLGLISKNENLDGVRATIAKYSGQVIDGLKYQMKKDFSIKLKELIK